MNTSSEKRISIKDKLIAGFIFIAISASAFWLLPLGEMRNVTPIRFGIEKDDIGIFVIRDKTAYGTLYCFNYATGRDMTCEEVGKYFDTHWKDIGKWNE